MATELLRFYSSSITFSRSSCGFTYSEKVVTILAQLIITYEPEESVLICVVTKDILATSAFIKSYPWSKAYVVESFCTCNTDPLCCERIGLKTTTSNPGISDMP